MKKIVYSQIFIGFLLSSQVVFAETNISDQPLKKETVKELKVQKGATKVGEDSVKTRGLTMNLGQPNELENEANLNVGKIEFYVK